MIRNMFSAALLLAFSSMSVSQIYSFTDGDKASASRVNTNFSEIESKLQAREDRIERWDNGASQNQHPASVDPHKYIPIKQPATPGAIVRNTAGDFVIVDVPFREFSSGKILTLRMPVGLCDESTQSSTCNNGVKAFSLSLLHTKNFEPNTFVGGYPSIFEPVHEKSFFNLFTVGDDNSRYWKPYFVSELSSDVLKIYVGETEITLPNLILNIGASFDGGVMKEGDPNFVQYYSFETISDESSINNDYFDLIRLIDVIDNGEQE